MSEREAAREVHGVVLLDKPAGWSSNQALQRIKRLYRARKAGHTGSLDPFATGMLPICLGEASKTAGYMLDAAKSYRATARFGQATSTGDIEGERIREMPVPQWDRERVETVLCRFLGEIEQVPPMHSALKYKGEALYKLARQGREVPREARRVTIHSIRLIAWDPPLMRFELQCSKGTYVRTLAEDIAREMGSCAHLESLRRLSVGAFTESQMVDMQELEERAETDSLDGCLLAPDAGISHWPRLELEEVAAGRFCHGNPVRAPATGADRTPGPVRVYGPSARLLGLGELKADGRVQPRRLMKL